MRELHIMSLFQFKIMILFQFLLTYYIYNICASLSLISLYLFVVQMLVVQAVRPDRLQSAMGVFAAKALGKSESHPSAKCNEV